MSCKTPVVPVREPFNPIPFVQSSLVRILLGCNIVYGVAYEPHLILTSGIRCTGEVSIILPTGMRVQGNILGFDEYSGVGVIFTTDTLTPITRLAPLPSILDDIASIDNLVWPGIVGGIETDIITGIRYIIQTPTATPTIGSPSITPNGIVGIVVDIDPVVRIIPIDKAIMIAKQIENRDIILPISLGFSLIESNNILIVSKVLPSVLEVQIGDILVSLDGKPVHRIQDISLTGSPVTLVIKRDGNLMTVTISPIIGYPISYSPCGSCCI